MSNKSIILLSGGLDSVVCLGLCKTKYNVQLALTFDYGQKSVVQEIEAAKKISDYYNTEHKVIKLEWLKNITKTALVSEAKIPEGIDHPEDSAKAVWVPNRNGLFLNIEEGATFPDNTQEFADRVSAEFEYSTLNKPKVLVPLINYDKNDIVKLALEQNMPLELIRSCYQNSERHCGVCESCTRLKNALEHNGDTYYTKILF